MSRRESRGLAVRYTKEASRLVLDVEPSDVEQTVACVKRFFVPRYARKMYFLGDDDRTYPGLELLAEQCNDFTIVREGAEPTNLLQSCRVVHQENALVVVPGEHSRRRFDEWDALIAQIEQ
jgi:hypothetical protein